ncbi:hypothetical protein [Bacillus sp. Marseille-Q3570]|uniref:response regulator aspartate phosphatase n=1 Tax=Bacillus sp. Marseille-Q3570 TaxID=2963522 RepID=UPI0021B7CA42|nr:hypothetical protein [Bacillus sp. Marseille-Q3570]
MSISVDSSVFSKKIDRWYEVIKAAQEEESIKLEKELRESFANIEEDLYTYNYYRLVKFRYHLFLQDLDAAEETLQDIEPFNETNELLQYYYYHFKGVYYYLQRRYQDSIKSLKKAQPLIIFCDHKNEIGEFHYKLAASYYELDQNALSIKHLDSATRIFQNNHIYKRSSDCELLHAFNLQDLKEYEEAELHYHNALRYCDHFNDSDYKHTVLFNLGIFYFSQKYNEEAERYFIKTRDYFLKERKFKYAIKASYQLAKLYYVLDDLETAKQYQNDGILLTKENGDKFYEHKLNTLYVYSKATLAENESKILEGISYFEENKLWKDVVELGEHLIKYFHGINNFKQSSLISQRIMYARNNLN